MNEIEAQRQVVGIMLAKERGDVLGAIALAVDISRPQWEVGVGWLSSRVAELRADGCRLDGAELYAWLASELAV